MSAPSIEMQFADSARNYPIWIGAGVLEPGLQHISAKLSGRPVAIITDENVARLHLDRLQGALAALDLQARTLILPAGEASKSFSHLQQVCEFLLEQGLERDDCLLAFGGGVIGDLAGLASALVKRGTGFIQIPTSLLAQVDSSVGGKTAINTKQGKNLVGAFHQPVMVLADTGFLQTLDDREWRSGFAEILKMALLGDAEFFNWLEEYGASLRTSSQLTEAITRSVQAKADIVGKDELEHANRALLNLGHTFAHALEAEAPKASLLHGEAVAAGLGAAFSFSVKLGLCADKDARRVRRLLRKTGLPHCLSAATGGPYRAEALIRRMQNDKKNTGGKIRLVLCEAIGSAMIRDDVAQDTILDFLDEELAE